MDLKTYLDNAVRRFRDRPYLRFYEETLSFVDFGNRVNRVASGLREAGFKKGDIIHVYLQNSPDVLISYFAVQAIGAIAGPINNWWKAPEVEYLLNDSRGKGLIVEEQFLPVLDEIRPRCPHLKTVIEVGPSPRKGHLAFSSLLEAPETAARSEIAERDIAYIFYTSGTTGNPKGVLLSHRNVLADVDGISRALHLDEGMTALCFLPLFHVNAMLTCVFSIGLGQTVVLRRAFSASEFWEVVDRYKVHFWSAVPAVYQILLSDPGRQRFDLSSLQFGICGAAPLTEETMTRFEQAFRIPIVEGYGLTEATCVSTINPREGVRKVGSIGLPLPGQTVKIVDEQGAECPVGKPGEIVIKADCVMEGYYNRPEETRQVIDGEGFLHTGDVGRRDEDGYIFIVDRIKDMIIRGGENIYPKELDNLLATHPKIAEAATVGVPDETMGEEIKVFVTARDSSLTEEEVVRFCRERLADFKVPRYVEILEEDLPRNPIGKVMKKVLRQWGKTPRPKKPAAAAASEGSVQDIFETMAARARPDALQGVNASLGYRITGEGGGEWTAVIRNGAATVSPGLQKPDVTTTMAARDFLDLNLGRLDGMTAFTAGKLKAEGDTGLLVKSTRFFKKYTPSGAKQQQAEELIVLKQLLSVPQRFTTGPLMGKFLRELRDNRRILGNRCPKCRRIQTPPREVCAVCRVRVDELVEIGPEGKVVSYDITYYASPDPLTGESRETPYCAAFFVLDGCGSADIFWHEVNPAHIDRVRKGARVRPVWAEQRTGSITDIKYFDIID